MKTWRSVRGVPLSVLVIMLVACSGLEGTPLPVETETTIEHEGRALVLGDISDDPAEVIDGTQPIADYLAEHLKEYGISSGQVRVVSSISEM